MDYTAIFNNLVQAYKSRGFKVTFTEKMAAWDNSAGQVVIVGKTKRVMIRKAYSDMDKVHILTQLLALEAMSAPGKACFVVTEESFSKPGFIEGIADFALKMVAAASGNGAAAWER